ncbi:MAG: hypothetical protein QOC77_3543 [Thermoleophilaceae bacterium]|jgi:hypothetical protein|nr:hypothetical protein [Thermoleophilaceae bacterium]
MRATAAAFVTLALAGCGSHGYGHDVKGFTQEAASGADQQVLRSIATYRTTADDKLACSLVTSHFVAIRFEGKIALCQAIARHQDKRELPKSATVEGIAGNSATVRIAEASATRSLYKMKRESGIWKIDDIVEAP